MRRIFVCLCLLVVGADAANFFEITKKHCFECHNPKKNKGDVDLTVFNSTESFFVHYDTLKDFYEQVKSGDMPPEEESKLTAEERKVLVDYLGSVIHKLENSASNKTGPTRIRRLTDYEYDNTVKTVTGLDLNLSVNFPADGGGGEGFSNDSAILGVSPLQFEKYLEAAERISTYSRFDLNKGFTFTNSQSAPETKKDSEERINKEIEKLLVKLYPKNFSIERFLPKLMKAVNEYNLSGKDNSKFENIARKNDLNVFFLKRGVDYFSSSYGKGIIERDAIKPWFSLVQDKYDPKKAAKYSRKFVEEYEDALKKIDTVEEIKKKSYLDFKNNIRNIFTFTEKELLSLINKSQLSRYQELQAIQDFMGNGMRSQYRNQFAKQIIPHVRDLLYKAHRKPPDQKDVLEMSKDFIDATAKFGMDVAARMFVIRTFAHMRFVFRHEEKSGRPTKVTDYELANRLSYFLWATAPDDELLKLASENKLSDAKVLENQVKRMLKDRKSSGLAKYFAAQWLKFGEILEIEGPSTEKFPEFDKDLAEDMWKESAICFEYIVKNDRSVLEIIDADYTFLNGRLKKLYGLGGGSDKFSKVTLNDKKRGGITGHASVLTLTSSALRTSPILRGNWVISALLGTPTPPAPANVPPLPDEEVVSKELTLKEQLEAHRKSPQCKGCHQKIDPLGFPLENYDPIGRWRKKYDKASIDAIGETSDGVVIDGPEGLKKYLLKEKDSFLKNMSRKLLGFALGRSVEYYDFYIINEMVESLKKNDYKFSSMVIKIVTSYQFQHKN